jgi:phospholipid/cholesterol/gamma-HCH transport system substrate-binding protein
MKLTHEVVVGLVFFGILLLLGFFTIYLSDVHFGRGQTLVVDFSTVRGLKQGDNVNVLGLKSGKVKTILLNERMRGVRVTLWLKQPIVLSEDSEIQVNDATLLGGKQVDIDPGTPGRPLIDTTKPLVGRSSPELAKSLVTLLEDAKEPLRRSLQNLEQITAKINEGQGLLGGIVNDAGMRDSIARILTSVDRFTRELAEGTLYQNAERTVANVAAITDDVRAGKGVVGRLLSDERTSADVAEVVANLKEVTGGLARGEGTAGRLLKDDTLYANLNQTFADAGAVVASVRNGEGTIGRLVKEETLYANVNATFADVAAITAGLRNGEGSLGKLLRRDDLYDELARAIQQIRGAVQDAREAAPVTTFTAALFAIF